MNNGMIKVVTGIRRCGKTSFLDWYKFFAVCREILKSLPVRERLAIEAKDPHAARRSTCTLSTLINLNAEHMLLAA